MKTKRNPLIALLAGVFMTAAGVLAPYCYLLLTPQQGSDIIGGAGLSTYLFLASTVMDGWPFCLLLFGISLTVMALIWLLFFKRVSSHCHWDTTALGIGISATGGMGLTCFLHWVTITAFHEMSKHPILYPSCIVTGTVCFVGFIALCGWYLSRRKANWTVWGLVLDVLTAVWYLPAFFFFFCYLIDWLSKLVP